MTIRHLPLLAVALIGSLIVSAQKTKQIPLPASQNPSNADLPISAAVWAGDTLYVSGWLDPDIKGTLRYHVTNRGSAQGHPKVPRIAKTDARRCGDDACVPWGRSCERRQDGLCWNDGRIHPILRHQGPTEQARTHHGAGGSARWCSWRFDRNRPSRSASKVAAGFSSGEAVGPDGFHGRLRVCRQFSTHRVCRSALAPYRCFRTSAFPSPTATV